MHTNMLKIAQVRKQSYNINDIRRNTKTYKFAIRIQFAVNNILILLITKSDLI